MATLKAKEVGGSDSSNLSASAPNDTDYGVNFEQYGTETSYTRDSAVIDAPAATSSICIAINSFSPSDVELRVTGFNIGGAGGAGDGIDIKLIDVNSGTSENGYLLTFEPNRAGNAKFKIQRSDSGTETDLDNTVETTWTDSDDVDLYLRFDGSTVTARAVQAAQSLDETLSAADSTYAFGTGAQQIDYAYFRSTDTLVTMDTIEIWDMTSAGLTTILKGGSNIVLNSSGDIVGV